MIEIRIPNKAFPEMSVRTLSDGTTVNYVNWKSFVVMPEQSSIRLTKSMSSQILTKRLISRYTVIFTATTVDTASTETHRKFAISSKSCHASASIISNKRVIA